MKEIKFLFAAFVLAMFISCGGGTNTNEKETEEKTTEENELVLEEDGKVNPFKDFPAVSIKSNSGDYILTPSLVWQQDATTDGPESQSFIFYSANMVEPGAEYSTVDFLFDKGIEIPNYMIIPIKSGQTAKVGDIVLTWWQSGSGMQRAIVTDATDPSSPSVNYIDIDWDNPATNAYDIGIGQMTEQIEANTFHVLKNTWEPGTTIAVKDGVDYKHAIVISISGSKVLAMLWSGSMKIFDKSDCIAVAIKPNVKVGDEVQAPWVGTFVNTKVVKIDQKNGRVWCEDPYSDDPMVIPFGDVTTELDI